MIEEGMGYAVGYDKIIHVSQDIPLCFRPLETSLENSVTIVWKKYQVFTRAAQVFLEKLQEMYNK